MNKYIIDDDLLSKNMIELEKKTLDKLPREEDLSHTFSKGFEKKMNKLIRQEKRSPFMQSFINYGRRAAIITLIALSVSLLTTMSVEAYRIKFFEVITRVFEEYTSISFNSEDGISDEKIIAISPTYVPKEFTILEKETDDYVNRIIYVNKDNMELVYEQALITNGQILLDTEGVKVKTMEIEGQIVNYFSNKGMNTIYWNDEKNMYTLFTSIDIEEIIKMATSVIKNK